MYKVILRLQKAFFFNVTTFPLCNPTHRDDCTIGSRLFFPRFLFPPLDTDLRLTSD